jgi:hypothetical protein
VDGAHDEQPDEEQGHRDDEERLTHRLHETGFGGEDNGLHPWLWSPSLRRRLEPRR